MNDRDGILRHFALALVLALIFYAAFFAWVQHRRSDKGPWSITFSADAQGAPCLVISEAKLHISQSIHFAGQTLHPASWTQTIHFDRPVTNLPFGKMLFQDPTFLPGTVTFAAFGHRLELLPRVLKVDSQEHRWGSQPDILLR